MGCGHTIGSHGLTHHRLTKFDENQVKIELVESRKMLEDLFQVDINCLAYPYGAANPKITQLASSIYRYSFAGNDGSPDWKASGFSQIRREYLWPHSSLQDIEKLIVGFGTYNNSPYK